MEAEKMDSMNHSMNQGREFADLDALFRAYREACPAPEPSANFMPAVWRRIEERQRSQFFLGRWARAFVTAAAALSMGMAAYLYVPHPPSVKVNVDSYVEASTASHTPDSQDLADLTADLSMDEL
jgi:hypothetical protein